MTTIRRAVVLWLLGVAGVYLAHAEAVGRPPHFLLTAEGGLGMTNKKLVVAGGGMLTLQGLVGPILVSADAQGLSNSTWLGRGGVLIGWRYRAHYVELVKSTTSGDTTTNEYAVYSDKIQSVAGLALAVDKYQDGVRAEAGLGLAGQHRIEFLGVYDATTHHKGFRLNFMLWFGRRSSVTFGSRIQSVFMGGGEFLISLGFGVGGGYDIHDQT